MEELHNEHRKLKKGVFILGGIVLLLAILSGVIYYYFAPAGVGAPSDNSPFQQYVNDDGQDRPIDPNYDQPATDGTEYTSPYVGEYQRIYSSVVDYWADWNWEDKVVEGRIQEVDYENDELTILVTRPKEQPFTETIVRVLVKCPVEETYQVSGSDPTGDYTDQNFNFFDNVEERDVIHAYCLDESCLNLGKACILTKLGE